MFNHPGYDLKFVIKIPCKDITSHKFTLVYKFYSPLTKYIYILNADYHAEDVFAIKFYVKQHSKSDYKYSKITNKKDLPNILITCAKVVPILMAEFPTASFGFAASRSLDDRANKVEGLPNNQRFQAYSYLACKKFGTQTFAHFDYPAISSYLLLNKNSGDVEKKEKAIVDMFRANYHTMLDI